MYLQSSSLVHLVIPPVVYFFSKLLFFHWQIQWKILHDNYMNACMFSSYLKKGEEGVLLTLEVSTVFLHCIYKEEVYYSMANV